MYFCAHCKYRQRRIVASMKKVPYWILEVGPVIEGQYQYAIVSDPFRATLFILARDVTDFYANYNDDILARLPGLGFEGLNGPIRVTQEGCTYDSGHPGRLHL